MSHRLSLRAAVVALGVTGAVLAPATAALATDEPTRAATEAPSEAAEAERAPTAAPEQATEAKPEPTVAPEENAEDGADRTPAKPEPTRAPEEGEIPRGGVAAGERPASEPNGNTALYGTAAGTVLLAGAGTYVLRRRAGAQRNG
nr:hypothetical protein [Streptomyces ruber]